MEFVAPIAGWTVGLAALLMVLGWRSRRSGAEPRCARCRADVRALAWDPAPRCPCGQDLRRYGAVRTRRASSVRWMIGLGPAILLAGAGAGALLWPTARGDRLGARLATDGLLRAALAGDVAWADGEVLRRAREGSLPTSFASDLLLDASATPWSSASTLQRRRTALLIASADVSRRELHAASAAHAEFVLNTRRTPSPSGAAGGSLPVTLGMDGPGDSIDESTGPRFARIERVEVDGVAVSFRMPGLEFVGGPGELVPHPFAPDQVDALPIVGLPCSLWCSLPADHPPGPATLAITATVGFFPSPMALAGDPVCNGRARARPDAPLAMPWEWGVQAFGERVRLTIPIQVLPLGARPAEGASR